MNFAELAQDPTLAHVPVGLLTKETRFLLSVHLIQDGQGRRRYVKSFTPQSIGYCDHWKQAFKFKTEAELKASVPYLFHQADWPTVEPVTHIVAANKGGAQ